MSRDGGDEPRAMPLADLIKQVTDELIEAEEHAQSRGRFVMELQECMLELALSVQADARGGLRVWVIEVGAGASRAVTNTVRVTFVPRRGELPIATVRGDAPGEP